MTLTLARPTETQRDVQTRAREVRRGSKRLLRVTVSGALSVEEARGDATLAALEWDAYDADLDCFKGGFRESAPLAGAGPDGGMGMVTVARHSLTYIFEFRPAGRADGKRSARYRR